MSVKACLRRDNDIAFTLRLGHSGRILSRRQENLCFDSDEDPGRCRFEGAQVIPILVDKGAECATC